MHFQKSDIEKYLQGVWDAIEAGKYQIAPRPKNRKLLTDYIITEDQQNFRSVFIHYFFPRTRAPVIILF